MKIYLIGLLGSGKSVLGKKLAELAKLPFIDLDDALEEQEGMKVSEIFSGKGEEYFREIESVALRKQSETSEFVMATGGGTPCFHDNMFFMNQTGVTIFLDTPVQEIVKRMDSSQRKSRPLLAGVADNQLEEKLKDIFAQRLPYYQQAHYTMNGVNVTPSAVLQLVS
jgi:shikimate kinase